MSYVQVFSQNGGLSVYNLNNETKTLIVITEVDEDSNESKVYLANAPMTGISIKRLTDHTITKSLGGDFLLAAFGDTPDEIRLSGLNFFGIKCPTGASQATYDDIMDFYERNKVSTNPRRRLDITFSSATRVFRCALIGMDAKSSGDPEYANVLYTYTLSLVGVPKIGTLGPNATPPSTGTYDYMVPANTNTVRV